MRTLVISLFILFAAQVPIQRQIAEAKRLADEWREAYKKR